MSTIFVKPVAGALVRQPRTMTALPESGAEVSLDGDDGRFWRRRLADGSVIAVDKPVVAAPAVAEESVTRTERGGRR